MAGTNHHHQRHNLRLAVPSAASVAGAAGGRPYPLFPSTPSSAATPSKLRRRPPPISGGSAAASAVLILCSLRSFYSLLPFLRSAPAAFSLFPFAFLVAAFSFALSLALAGSAAGGFAAVKGLAFPAPLGRPIAAKAALLAAVFLLRFHALRYCAAGASILADIAGTLVARSVADFSHLRRRPMRKGAAFMALVIVVVLLSYSWDRIGCFPISSSPPPSEGCSRVSPLLLPFVAGFVGFYERGAANWASLRTLGRRRVRLLTLGFATLMLLVPAIVSFWTEGDSSGVVSVSNLGWPLFNTVVFGVVLTENSGSSDDKVVVNGRNFTREFAVTFFFTLLLELFYFPRLSLPGFLFCGLLLWIAVRELGSSSGYVELGSGSESESLHSMIMKPIRHILSERKSRKIALFLLINTAYMVVEFVAGFMSNSLGLISDACHMLFDCAALAIGLYASYISKLPANNQFNYGRGRFEVLSGYVNAVFLILVGALIVLESFERILDPQEVSTGSLLAVSFGGLLVNIIGLIFFHEEHHHAHGGGSTCSHSHSHSHDKHHHHSHHKHDDKHAKTDHHHSVAVSHKSPQEQSDDGCENHGCNHDHDHHHHNEKKHEVSSCHGHEHDNHCHIHEYHYHDHKHENHLHNHENHDHFKHDHNDHNEHLHHHEGHTDQHLSKTKDENKNLDVSNKSSSNERTEGYSYHVSHRDNENCGSHAYSHSEKSEEALIREKQHKHHHVDHNMEGIFLHVLADTMGSVGVVISTLLIKYKGWTVADPACSIFISVMIVSSVMPLLRNSAEILLQRVPRTCEQDIKLAVSSILKIKGVQGIHNMHVWNFTNTDIVGTLHLHVSADTDKPSVVKNASELLHETGIEDLTIQVECPKS